VGEAQYIHDIDRSYAAVGAVRDVYANHCCLLARIRSIGGYHDFFDHSNIKDSLDSFTFPKRTLQKDYSKKIMIEEGA
jgi:hypothetical protein